MHQYPLLTIEGQYGVSERVLQASHPGSDVAWAWAFLLLSVCLSIKMDMIVLPSLEGCFRNVLHQC